MARPMVLVCKETLDGVWFKHAEGVPVCAIIRRLGLPIAPPTLTKLLSYVTACESATSEKVRSIIDASLNPPWLDPDGPAVQRQPSTYRYEGKMPLGRWVLNEWVTA